MSRRHLDARAHHGPDIFAQGSAHHAAELGSVQALQAVERAQRQAQGWPPLVVLEQRDDLLQCLPLHVAAERGHMAVAQHIVSHDVDVDAADGHQVRPLHLAAINNCQDMVRLLVSKGGNVTKTDAEGDMPSHWAATKGHVDMLETLLDCGAPVDASNKHGWTCLHRAAYNGRVAACAALVRRGASLHALTKSGYTPLHLAASNNHLGVMELLLQLGASTHFRDQQGATAGDMCISNAARGLLADKEAAAAARASSRTSATAAGAGSRPASTSATAAAAQPAPGDISHVAAMPRFRRTANDNVDVDGFPSTPADARGLHAEASDTPQTLLVDAAAAQGGGEGDTVELCDLRRSPDEPTWADQALAAGQLSRQSSSKQQHSRRGGLSAASSFRSAGGGVPDATKQACSPRASATPRRQSQANARFLQAYRLDKKGLFAP